MKEEILFDKLPFLDTMQSDRRQQILKYFRTAPDSLADFFVVENLAPNRVFVREGAPVDYVYLIANGIVKATDYRVFGTEFDFTRFDKAYAMGGMEVLMRQPVFFTTLTTVTKCTIIKIPIAPYVQWVRSDVDAMALEAQLMGEYLLEQGKLARAYLFLQGADRLMYLMIRKYEKYGKGKLLKVIIETCLLTDEEKIALCKCVSDSGADYIKTSTGFSKAGATFADVELFAKYVAPHVQIKAAGGISSIEDAEKFIGLGADRLGTSRVVKIAKALEAGEVAKNDGSY